MAKRFLDQIKGMDVVGSGGIVFGNVADLELSETKLSGLIVAVRKSHVAELGLTKPFWSNALVTIPVAYVNSIADVVVLSMTLEEFAIKLSKVKPPVVRLPTKSETPLNVAATPEQQEKIEIDQEFSVPWHEE